MMPRSRTTLRHWALPVLLVLCAGCSTLAKAGDADGGARAKETKQKERELALEKARLQLQLAELGAEDDLRQARAALEEARRELEEARLALQRFDQFERPSGLADSRLDVDRAAARARESEQELQQMEEMYASEPNLDASGERTRDLVLERHRAQLDFARRALELQRGELSDLEQRELPRKRRELEGKLVAAEVELRDAEAELRQGELKAKLALLEARGKLEKLERGGKDDDDEQDGDGDEPAGRRP